MENPALFILTASFNLLFNLTAMLISRKIARKITRWGWLIFFMQATYLLLSMDFMKNAVLAFRSLFANASALSYVIVAFLGASLAMVYWFSIDKAYAKMFSGGGKSVVPDTRPAKVADPQLTRLEFRTDSAKTLRGFAVHVKLKRGYTIQELGHFRILLQIAHDRTVDFWTGCQDGYAPNASLGADKSNQYGIRYTTLYRNKKSHFIPVPAFTGPSKFTGEIGRSTTTDEITFGINLEGQIPSYKTLDNLDGKILDM